MKIEDLLKSMLTLKGESNMNTGNRHLENSKDTWSRIQQRDDFAELGFNDSNEKDAWLKEWIENNPYSNIK